MATAEAEKAFSDIAYKMSCAEAEKAKMDESFNKVCPRHHYGVCRHRRCGPFKCTFSRGLFKTREEFVEHQIEQSTEKKTNVNFVETNLIAGTCYLEDW